MNNMRQHYFEPRANLPAKIRRALAVLAIAVPALGAALPVLASTFTVGGSGNTFIVTRDDTTAAETVNYRTVSLSAYAGQHYTAKSGTLTFPAGQSAVTNTVTETTPTTDAYRFQTGSSRSYRFELADVGGFPINYKDRSFSTGTTVSSSSAFGAKDLPINAGTITVTDGGYDQAYHSVTVNDYFSADAPKEYLVAAGAQLRATVTFHAREKDDGYQYIAIYANTSTSYVDTGAKDGDPGTVSYSRYMAGFTIDGNVSSTYYPYTFPLTSKDHACGEQAHPWSGNSNGNLHQQYFNTNCRAADGRLIIPTNLSSLYIRLNASGNLNDTWYASNVVAHVQAVDTNAPTALTASAAPGIHAKGNEVYVSVAFSEPVTGTPSLTTSWGTLSYFSGSGSNVLTFKGTIPDTASGALKVTGKSGTIKDLSGKALAGSMPDQTLASLDTSHVYAITYDLAGGALPEGASNPATYTYETPSFSLAPPVRPCYVFAGWTEGSGSTPNPSVAIYRSHGDRAYVANWTPITYFVHFDAGAADATGSMPDQTLTYDAPQALSSNAFTRAGYTFAGWRGADGAIYPDRATVLNLTNAQDAVVSLTAQWRPNIPYIDADGTERLCTDYTVLTNATGYVEYGANGEENWYVVTNAVTISGQLSFNDGRIHLILCDGATLTVTNGNGDAIYPSNNIDSSRELVLYGQANGTGGLVANGSGYGIRIHSGSVTINGGNVTATGGHPGIYAADTVTINGGSVTATGGEGNAGIYANSLVIINGGSVTATGGYGIRVNNSSITINGGNVTATATSGNSDGIYAGGTFTINGGSVTATATGGKNGIYAGGDITINGGTVTATGGSDTANHNGIYANKSLTINGGNVTATGGYCGIRATINKITLGWTNPADSITASGYYGSSVHVKDWQRFTDGDNVYKNNITGAALADIAGKTLVPAYSITLPEGVVASGVVTQIVNTAYARPGDTVTLSAAPGYAIGDITVNGVPLADGTCSFTASADGITVTATVGIPYIDADDTERICTDYTVLTNATGDVTYGTNGATAWYVVTTNVTISGQLYFGDTTAHLILCDGATLAVTNANGTAIEAIYPTIYGQTNGTGTVTATGNQYGIEAGGSVTIKGGTVTATATGTGGNGISADGVTIKGGTVTATATGTGGNGIFANGSVTINGGTVTATATGTGGNGIYSGSGYIILGWTKPTDSITASSYSAYKGVSVKSGQRLTDGSNIYLNNLAPYDIEGVTLRPAYRITLPEGVVASGVVTQDGTTAYAIAGTNVTLSAAAPGYAIGDITVNGVPLADGTCSFTASDASITVTATVGVPYIDEGGVERICTDFTVLTNATGDVEYDGGSGWYVVTNAVTISGKLSFADSTAHLILCDGATLAVTNSTPYDEAVRADGDLAIYGQTHGTGVLAANANGSDFGYAIYACYDLTINGGTVTANGHLAIYALDDLTVNGGTVTGNGGRYGIYALDDLTVNGGTVTGNGGRYGISVDVLTVNGGTVTGNAPDGVGIGIVALYAQWTAHNTYTVRFDPDGGTGTMPDQTFTYGVTTNLAANAFTRTGYPFLGWRGADGSIYPDGATVSNLIVRHAYHKEDIWKLYDRMPYPGKSNDDYSPGDGALQNTDGDNGVNLYTGFENVAWNPEDPATAALISQNAGWFDEHDARNGVSMKLVEDFPNFYRKPVDENQNAVVTLTAIWQPPVPYIDADGVEQQCLEYTVLTNAAGNVEYGTVNEESWYAVTNDVTISGQLYFNGKPRLIVCDGATLTVTNDSGEAIFSDFGIALYGQTNGTGIVTATGRHSEGGIYALDDLTINGVTVTATGGDSGIRTLGDVTINGGRVTATGDDYGIYAYQGSVTINGGNVAAVSTSGSVGIWAGGGMIHLGWRSPTDSIYASSYHASYATAFNQKFTDGTTIYQGWYTGNSQEGLEGKTFRPYNATPSYPAYLGLPDDPADDTTEESGIRAKYDAWAARYGYDASGVNEAAYLLNIAPWATPIELRIVGIEVVEGGARVRVVATAGGEAVDLSQINGVISVSAGDAPDALAPKAASGITYSEGEATIFVPASAGRFVKAVIGLTAPAE